MASFSAQLIRVYIEWIRRSKADNVDPDKMRAHIQHLFLYPESASPPQNLGSGIKLERVDIDAWPLYRVSPAATALEATNSAGSRSAMLYCHGGAFIHEIQAPHWTSIAQISRETGLDVLVPIYPLAPRPTATAEHLVSGMHEIVTRIQQPISCIAGDSAGGTLALLTMQHLLKVSPEMASRVRSLVLISPLLDCNINHPELERLEANDPWLGIEGLRVAMDLFRGQLSLSDPRVSPLFGDIANLPPMLLLCGTHDMLCADARRLSARIQHGRSDASEYASGSIKLENFTYVEQEDMIHVYALTPSFEGGEARKTIIDFVLRHNSSE